MMGHLSKRTGTAGEVDFAYDENGRMLSQDYGSSRLDYVYGPGSYAVSSATGHTPMDAGRDASRANNFAYDASGRMMHDSSRGLSIAYDMDGMPAVFLQDSGSGTWRELAVYDPSGWRVATYSYENGSLVSLRTDIMLDGRLGLYYFGARYFDPSFALWLTPDPARQYLNPYSYGGDPVNRVDYDGKWSWGEALLWGTAEVLTAGGVSAGAVALTLGGGGLQAAAINVGREAYSKGGNFSEWDWGKIWNADVSANLAMIPGYAEAMTNISFINRLWDSDNKWGTFTDYLLGGYGVDYAGHMAGGFNSAFFGGNMDYYRGNVVYSEGFLRILEKMGKSGGGDHFGSAALVTDRNNDKTIAHEFEHLRQTEAVGNRFYHMFDYLSENDGSPFPNDAYYTNSREMDAYFIGYLKENGYIDIYGNGLEEASDEDIRLWSEDFYREYRNNREKYRDAIEAKFGTEWVWHKNWWMEY